MIPRKIHYVWLGNGPKPTSVQDCINSWKEKMPNYEIKCWNENNFDIQSVTWVKEAIQMKKWSLASDYIRHYALFTEGGIYMDTDVKVFKSFDPFLHWDFFSSVEYHPEIFQEKGIKQINVKGEALNEGDTIAGIGILAACIAAQKGNPFKRMFGFFWEQTFHQRRRKFIH